MSRAIGISAAQFIGARVAGQVTYVLPHTKNGKPNDQRCIIPVYINSNKGTNRDGTPGRSDQFKLTAWGKLADICAKSLSKGKALDCICTPHSYEGRIYDAQGNMRIDNAGQPITVERVGFTIEKPVFGEESQKEIDLEIAEGRRHPNWNVPAHPDYKAWRELLQTRQNMVYTGGDTFGFARVIVPSGPGITLTTGQVPTSTPQQGTPAVDPNALVAVDPNTLATMIANVLQENTQTPATAQTPSLPPAPAPALTNENVAPQSQAQSNISIF